MKNRVMTLSFLLCLSLVSAACNQEQPQLMTDYCHADPMRQNCPDYTCGPYPCVAYCVQQYPEGEGIPASGMGSWCDPYLDYGEFCSDHVMVDGCFQWCNDHEEECAIGGDGDADADSDADGDPDGDVDEEVCEPQDQLACNDDNDVIWLDSCGQPEEGVVEDCLDTHGSCRDGVCGCEDGWFGEKCEQCVFFVNGEAGSDGNSGFSWDQALATVGAGLENASADGCDVWVVSGIYYPTDGDDRDATFQLVSGVGLYGGFAGTESSLDERNIEENQTILSGDIDRDGSLDDGNVYNVVTGVDDSILDGFTIMGGRANHPGFEDPRGSGGGMNNSGVSPRVTNCIFFDNYALNGGGMANSDSSPVVSDCIFSNNISRDYGGGMFNDNGASPTVTNCTFSDNESSDHGGGMGNNASSPTVVDCTFSGNTALRGGGIYNDASSPIFTDCTFSENSVLYGAGAMYNDNASSPTITNCMFSRNRSGGSCGGMCNVDYSTPVVTNCIFTENIAGGGGAMSNTRSSPTVTNCTFSHNIANTYSGGGMVNHESDTVVKNCTFFGNEAHEKGGGIHNHWSSPTVTNSIIFNNNAPSGPQIWDFTHMTDPVVTFSLVEGGYEGEGNIDADPLLDDELRLSDGSPCIDAGDNSGWAGDSTDLDGNPRIVDGDEDGSAVVDMGAYEFDPAL